MRQDGRVRALSDAERAVLEVMLAEDFPGAVELRQQVDCVVVSGGCGCGCPSVNLEVPGEVPLAEVTSRTPIFASVEGSRAGLIVFVDDGLLSCLEYYDSDDALPATWPNSSLLRPYV